MIKAIFTSKMSDYKIVDIILKITTAILMIMWVLRNGSTTIPLNN